MEHDPDGLQKHRIVRRPEDGISFEIDVAQCIGFTSMRVTISKLTADIDRADIRLISMSAQIVFLQNEIKRLIAENEALRQRMSDESDSRNRQMGWQS